MEKPALFVGCGVLTFVAFLIFRQVVKAQVFLLRENTNRTGLWPRRGEIDQLWNYHFGIRTLYFISLAIAVYIILVMVSETFDVTNRIESGEQLEFRFTPLSPR